jgi:hypothetical protein
MEEKETEQEANEIKHNLSEINGHTLTTCNTSRCNASMFTPSSNSEPLCDARMTLSRSLATARDATGAADLPNTFSKKDMMTTNASASDDRTAKHER